MANGLVVKKTDFSEVRNRMLMYTNQTLDLTKGVEDKTHEGYPYHVDLALNGCTANYLPDVYLNAPSTIISDVCETGNGYVRFYVTTNTGTVTIPTIRLTTGGEPSGYSGTEQGGAR